MTHKGQQETFLTVKRKCVENVFQKLYILNIKSKGALEQYDKIKEIR